MSFINGITSFLGKADAFIDKFKGDNGSLPLINNEEQPLQDMMENLVENKVNPVTSKLNWGSFGMDENQLKMIGLGALVLILIFKFKK